jgi:hypothetical protein
LENTNFGFYRFSHRNLWNVFLMQVNNHGLGFSAAARLRPVGGAGFCYGLVSPHRERWLREFFGFVKRRIRSELTDA